MKLLSLVFCMVMWFWMRLLIVVLLLCGVLMWMIEGMFLGVCVGLVLCYLLLMWNGWCLVCVFLWCVVSFFWVR